MSYFFGLLFLVLIVAVAAVLIYRANQDKADEIIDKVENKVEELKEKIKD